MSKLNQIVAVVNGVKTETMRALTEVHKKTQRLELFKGFTRTYKPLDEESTDTLPDEAKKVQVTVVDAVEEAKKILTNLFDVVATQDVANCEAKADLVVEGQTLLKDVPVTHLLFLEKQLQDIHKFVDTLPVLEESEDWSWDDNSNLYTTRMAVSNRTKKVPKVIVKAEATQYHPAQVDMFTEDCVIGHYHTKNFSGAMPAKQKKEMLGRVKSLQTAVKFAREVANQHEVEQVKEGEVLLNYVFGA